MALTLPKSYAQDVTQPIKVRNGGELVFTGNADVDTISVVLYNGGVEYEPGGSVTLNCIRADGVTMVVSGTVSGNVASATLTQACCAVPGMMTVVMQLTSGGTGAIFAAVYNVLPSSTDTVGDAGTIIADVAALIADIDAAVATIPTNYSALLASIAPTFSTLTGYIAGQYVWYNGTLYRFTADHAAGTWTGTDATAAVIGEDVRELKSAFDAIATVGGTSAQMVDSSKYVDGYRWDTTAGSDIDANPVAASGWTIINQQFFVDAGTTIGINTNSEIVVLGYAYDSNSGKYTRSAFIQGSSFVVDEDHYAYTFANTIRAFKVYISTAALNRLLTPLIIAINSQWDGNPNYGQVSGAKINSNVEIPQIHVLENEVESDIQDLQKLSLGTLEDGYINSASGAAMPGSSYKRTGFLHIQADKLKVAITFSVASVGFAFYDSRKKYISGFDYTGYNVGDLKEVSVPDNAYYFRYCAVNANVSLMQVLIPNYANAVSRIDTNPCFYDGSSECRTFKKILCIGDSLTAGQFDYKEDGVTKEFNAPEYSYPTFLKAMTGRDTTNAGDAGETTVSWYALHGQEDFSGHDACIIMLGRNDYVSGRETTSEERATAFANIISKVRTDNPQIPIFMSTLINYYTGSAAETMNDDIRTAATANNCYLLDISAYGRMVLSDDAYSHCTAEGYCTLAEYFFRYISYIMHNNYTDFKTIQFTGTNRSYS